MGCNSTKNLAVEPFNGHIPDNHTQARRPFTGHTSNIPPLEAEDLQEELLENATVNNVQRATNGLAFEIAFQEDDDSATKKHPPRRIQELLEVEKSTEPVTLDKLQEKLEEAEIRRNQILAQRVQSAKNRTEKMMTRFIQDGKYLSVPPENLPSPPNAIPTEYRSND
ncbi:unnamed protein product [Callosobruchus maculatus]|uniref:Uncharacterized protein n=1 Tax=Callosobruchus maculatus TaxID=64391 RepID=A0A653DCF4_CALMS|nr:unnamed protein product [Callosobruchus maculatus]